MNKDNSLKLANEAEQARAASYCPYSHFAVGAALLTESGEIFTGANIESSSYTPTVCAERVAFFTAVHGGHRDFRAIAIVGGREGEPLTDFCPPCGVCRQVMAEFADGDMPVLLVKNEEDYKEYTLAELLPLGFTSKDL